MVSKAQIDAFANKCAQALGAAPVPAERVGHGLAFRFPTRTVVVSPREIEWNSKEPHLTRLAHSRLLHAEPVKNG